MVVALPVAAGLASTSGPQLLHLLQFAFAVVVLLFSFGPRDLKDEVDDYVGALERHDRDEAMRRAKELLESTPLGALAARAPARRSKKRFSCRPTTGFSA